MAIYFIRQPAYVYPKGKDRPQYFAKETEIEVDDDLIPANEWEAVDKAAAFAIAKKANGGIAPEPESVPEPAPRVEIDEGMHGIIPAARRGRK